MAALRGPCRNCVACWEYPHERRTQSAGTARLVCRTFPMVQIVEGYKVIHIRGNGLTAINSQPVKNYALNNTLNTNDLDYPTGKRLRKEEATLLARLALTGHVVHRGRCSDYTVCKYGYAQYCQDLIELHAFAARLGVCHE